MRRLHIVMLFDVPAAKLVEQDLQKLLATNVEYRDERDVLSTLRAIGHSVSLCAIHDNLEQLLNELRQLKPDLVFCMFESFNNSRHAAPHLVAMLELLNIPFTGANAFSLKMCSDKALTKKILSYHGISTPKFCTFDLEQKVQAKEIDLPFPAIVKPLGLDASEGISNKSLVRNADEALLQISRIRKQYRCPIIIEEYIEGREFYIGVLGSSKPIALSPQELFFKKLPKNVARIATYKAKWDETYRRKYGIDSGSAANLTRKQKKQIQDFGIQIFNALGIGGYARIDLRMNDAGQLYFIEANPNPAIKMGDDFPGCARDSGWSYRRLIQHIVSLAAA